jgi:hypothetical protein
VAGEGLKGDRQLQVSRQRRRHHHQRQAVAGARIERFGRVARQLGVVFEPQLRLGVQGIDQPALRAELADRRCNVALEVVAHRRAEREHGARIGHVLWRGKGGVFEQARWRLRRQGRRDACRQQQRCEHW